MVIIILNNRYLHEDKKYLIIAPTGKVALSIYSSTTHLHEEWLSLSAKGKLNLKLVIIHEFAIVS